METTAALLLTSEIFNRVPITRDRIDPLVDELFDEAFREDMELRPIPEWPGGSLFRGREGVRVFFREWFGAFESISTHFEGPEIATESAAFTVVLRGTVGGVTTEMRFGMLAVMREGRTASVTMFRDPEDAHRALAGE